jgi:hypothetical protein
MSLNAAYTLYLIAKVEAGDTVADFRLETRTQGYPETMYTLYCGSDYPTFLGTELEATKTLEGAVETLVRVAAKRKAVATRKALLGR